MNKLIHLQFRDGKKEWDKMLEIDKPWYPMYHGNADKGFSWSPIQAIEGVDEKYYFQMKHLVDITEEV